MASGANGHGEQSEAISSRVGNRANCHGERSEAIPSRVKNASLEMAWSLRSSP
jgi:hypothetical protein